MGGNYSEEGARAVGEHFFPPVHIAHVHIVSDLSEQRFVTF